MADDKTPEPVHLVAVERGFYLGRLVEPGTTFVFHPNPAKPDRIPKWAKPTKEAHAELAAKKARDRAFDTKPKEAAAAVQRKGAQLSGSSLA